MNRGLLIRAFRESWPTTLLLCLLLGGAEALLAFVLAKFGSQLSQQWMQMDFARTLMQAMVGAEMANRMGGQMLQSMAWLHPVVLSLAWAHALLGGTRVPAAEIEQGTADVLLSLPVSRRQLFASETVVWLASGALLVLVACGGSHLGWLALPAAQRPVASRVWLVVVNFFCLYAAVGGLACLASALSNRRGRAITFCFVVLIALLLLNYLAQFWRPLQHIVFLSPLHYFQPGTILSGGAPWLDMALLLGAGIGLWIAACITFVRRDLCTV